MINHVHFAINPLSIPLIAIGLAKQREMVEKYAVAYSSEHGETVFEYVSRIGEEVYPGHRRKLHGQRASFRTDLRAAIRKLRTRK